jgi:glycosyltransferase involved in cell wall biosynthesis
VRICIIGKYPPIQGGVSMRTYWTAQRLAERGHEVHVVTNAREATAPFRMHMRAADWRRCEGRVGRGSVKVHWTDPADRSQSYIPMASPFVSKLAAVAARAHAARAFDVIYSHYMEPYGIAGHLAAQMTGVPHVTRMAGSDAGRLWRHPQLEPLYDHVLRSANMLIATGAVAKRAAARGVDAGRIVSAGGYRLPTELFTPHGRTLDLTALRDEIKDNAELSDALWGGFAADRPYFGIYGKLGRNKGSFALLAALQELKRRGRDVGVVALAHGQPEVERAFRQQARDLGVAGNILQIPFLPHWRVPQFLRGCLAVCCLEQDFPIEIHTPIVVREVLLCGRCLIASTELLEKLPHHDRLPDGYGCVAVEDVNDVGELSRRLAAIVDDPEPTAAVGRRGYEFARLLQNDENFPQRLQQILSTAARRQKLRSADTRRQRDNSDSEDVDPFALTRLCAGVLGHSGRSGAINLSRARAILASIKGKVAKGQRTLRRLLPPIEIEIAVQAVSHSKALRGGESAASRVRQLNIRRWALGQNDFAKLRPVRGRGLALVSFDFDVRDYMAAKKTSDFPHAPSPRPTSILVRRCVNRRCDLHVIDNRTARILQLSEGKLTSGQIAAKVVEGNSSSSIDKCLNWMENLLRHGLIDLQE